MTDLNALFLAAHDADDKPALVKLYTRAADQSRDPDAACFYLTHAYVFALEIAHPWQQVLKQRLVLAGRETP